MLIFRNAFNMGLKHVTCIGGWCHSGISELNDARIDELLSPVLRRISRNCSER